MITPLKVKISEEELIAGLLAGDRKAIGTLYDNYSAALYGIILRIVKTEEIAEDILQDTFVKIWRSFERYDASKGRLFTWLANMARNMAIDQVRSKYSRNTKSDERIGEHTASLEIVYNSTKNPDHIGIRTLACRLKPEHQVIVDLVYFQGYTHTEAAEQLQIPVGTLKTRLRVAIRFLRAYFN
ncbi:RNA polymerase sigma factor [Hufsiella ginkgonis]|uniref:RNA polymerase sigma factor n=1 Tax=Hufsiella ginkgonis TaxID=2695274 RepID=UPI0034E28FC5